MKALCVVIFAHVHQVSMAPNVRWIIDHVNLTPVGIMVYDNFILLSKKRTAFFLGVCNETSDTTFVCLCQPGWSNIHCETQINACDNVSCLNNGICRPSLLNYTCECLGTSYSGRHCEIIEQKTVVRQVMSRSFSYIAIIFIAIVATFFIFMDILKYIFGIDLTKDDSERIQRKRQRRKVKRRPVIQRFIYVNTPPQSRQRPRTTRDISITEGTHFELETYFYRSE